MIGPRARVAIAAAFFAYVVLIRTHDLANSFLMLGEQTRDWAVALGGWRDLPLVGAPSTAGGRGFGPAYYWILWLGRHLVGPFTSNLPHAGGITIALLQSVADTWLLVVLSRRIHIALALAMCLFIASAPFDISISGVIWNPPVAAALVKMATALGLSLGATPPRWKVAATAALAWLAVQAHLSAVFVAAPIFAALIAQPLIARPAGVPATRTLRSRVEWRRAAEMTALAAAVVLVLQIPYLVSFLREPGSASGPTGALEAIAQPRSFDVVKSYSAVVNGAGDVLVHKNDTWKFQLPVLAAAIVILVRWRRDPMLLAVSVGAIVMATALFSTWTRPYDSYWFLTVTTALVLTIGMAIAAIPNRIASHLVAAACLVVVAALQQSRVAQAREFFSYPQYRVMRIGSTKLAAMAPALRDIRVNFEGAHPTMDKYIIYKILGGRIEPGAPIAFIDEGGDVRIE
jgi:hypothetical protein